jgi:hypothetical protein
MPSSRTRLLIASLVLVAGVSVLLGTSVVLLRAWHGLYVQFESWARLERVASSTAIEAPKPPAPATDFRKRRPVAPPMPTERVETDDERTMRMANEAHPDLGVLMNDADPAVRMAMRNFFDSQR